MMRFVLACLLCLFTVGWAPARADSEREAVTFRTASGAHVFEVEVARTDAQRQRGLMFRRYMPENHGMLFTYDRAQPIYMWMKNTYIPLDMVFATRNGRVTAIIANAEPLSESIISSGGPAYAVIELNGGVAARIGLQPGDQIVNPVFKP